MIKGSQQKAVKKMYKNVRIDDVGIVLVGLTEVKGPASCVLAKDGIDQKIMKIRG